MGVVVVLDGALRTMLDKLFITENGGCNGGANSLNKVFWPCL